MDFRQAAIARLANLGIRGNGVRGMDDPSSNGSPSTPVITGMPGLPGQRSGPFQPSVQEGTLGKQGQGAMDPRSLLGIFLRGNNVYSGGQPAAHQGPNINMGRPKNTDNMRQVAASRMRRG